MVVFSIVLALFVAFASFFLHYVTRQRGYVMPARDMLSDPKPLMIAAKRAPILLTGWSVVLVIVQVVYVIHPTLSTVGGLDWLFLAFQLAIVGFVGWEFRDFAVADEAAINHARTYRGEQEQ